MGCWDSSRVEPEQDQTGSKGERRDMVSASVDQVSGGGVADLCLSSSVSGLQVDDHDPLLPQFPHRHLSHVFILVARDHLYSNIGQTFCLLMHHPRYHSTRF